MEVNNLIVPVVGDFAGAKALKAIGAYLREHDTSVRTFYLSNVEQYLFQDDSWRRFMQNVSSMPLDSSSTFIRAVFNGMAYRAQARATARVAAGRPIDSATSR